jgi:hypothetical protein
MLTKLRSVNFKGKDHSEELGVDGRIIQNGSSGNRLGRCGVDVSGSG